MGKNIKSTELIRVFKKSNVLFEGELTAMEMETVEGGGTLGLIICCISYAAEEANVAYTAELAETKNFSNYENVPVLEYNILVKKA